MPLQQLVHYFNDRFNQENQSVFCPFILEDNQVSGLFGPLKIQTVLTPIRPLNQPATISGYSTDINVSVNKKPYGLLENIDTVFNNPRLADSAFDSIIHFDRLSRTVHMLNYLPWAHLHNPLFLDVDARHILGVKQNHGAYFEEVITRCGLATSQVVIVLTLTHYYADHVDRLLAGLVNYRHRGYQIALKFEELSAGASLATLIDTLRPGYVWLSAQCLENVRDSGLLAKLHTLKSRISAYGGLLILADITEKKSVQLARHLGVDWVRGAYYEQSAIKERKV